MWVLRAVALVACTCVLAAVCTGSGVVRSHEHLVDWAVARGAAVSPSVAIRPATNGGGVGVFADSALDAKTTVFAVPLSLAINVEHALADKELGHLWEMLPDLSDLDVLAGFLAMEAKRGDGFWQPYLATLKSAAPETPTTFSQDEIDLLAPSKAVHAISEERHRDISEVCASAFTGLLRRNEERACAPTLAL